MQLVRPLMACGCGQSCFAFGWPGKNSPWFGLRYSPRWIGTFKDVEHYKPWLSHGVNSVRLDNNAQKFNTLAEMLQIDFIRVKL